MLQVMGINIPPAVLLFDVNFPNKQAEVQCYFFKKRFFFPVFNQGSRKIPPKNSLTNCQIFYTWFTFQLLFFSKRFRCQSTTCCRPWFSMEQFSQCYSNVPKVSMCDLLREFLWQTTSNRTALWTHKYKAFNLDNEMHKSDASICRKI